jgi:DNA adenine methylase
MLACDRLKHINGNRVVQIEKRDAVELIRYHNTADTLIYADPPYVRSTRSSRNYVHEFTDADHRQLLDALLGHLGPVAISGYATELYDTALQGWHRYEISTLAESSGHRTEVLWCNYPAERQIMMEI